MISHASFTISQAEINLNWLASMVLNMTFMAFELIFANLIILSQTFTSILHFHYSSWDDPNRSE